MKIKIGMYAPAKEQDKATGTDGTPTPGNQNQNLNEKKGKLLPFSPNPRVGSSTVGIGAQVEQVDEHPGTVATFIFEMESYPEAKSLIGSEIKALYRKFKSWPQVAEIVGSSESFVRQNASRRK